MRLISMTDFVLEQWLPVVGYEGLYEISNLGNCKSVNRVVKYSNDSKNRVARFKSKEIKKIITEQGYIKYRLSLNGESKSLFAHRLVAISFIKNEHNKPHINHIDSNQKNNCVDNLEWVTPSENLIHSYNLGNRIKKLYCAKYDNRLSIVQIKNGVIIKKWESAKVASISLGFDASSISKCCRGKLNTHKGYSWEYN